MATRVVRILDADMQRVDRLSGMSGDVPFAARLNAALNRLEGRGLQDLRLLLREEFDRVTGVAS